MQSIRVKFVSKKVSKVRWLPQTSLFITGTWDDEDNNICVWNCPKSDSDVDENPDVTDPPAVAETAFLGGVTDLKVFSNDLLFASSSIGTVSVYKYIDQKLSRCSQWDRVHHFVKQPAACTGIAVKGNDVASVGEDGRLFVHNFNRAVQTKKIESSDMCALTAVTYLRYQEVVTGNVLGYLRAWDLRSSANRPSYSLSVPGDHLGISSMSLHPTQPHILASGHDDGTLCIWDLRQERKPTTMLSGHSSSVMEVLFHHHNPDFLFTCSMDGSVLQWDSSVLRLPSNSVGTSDSEKSVFVGTPWLNCDSSKHKLEIVSLFSQGTVCVNSLDFSNNTLIWSADNEAVYYQTNIDI